MSGGELQSTPQFGSGYGGRSSLRMNAVVDASGVESMGGYIDDLAKVIPDILCSFYEPCGITVDIKIIIDPDASVGEKLGIAIYNGADVTLGGVLPNAGPVLRAIDKVRKARAARTLPALRGQYVNAVEALAARVPGMRQAGMGSEQIARALHAERNALKVSYREISPADAVRRFEARNMERYGDPLGPSIDQLRAAGKSWDDIIKSATRPGGSDLGF